MKKIISLYYLFFLLVIQAASAQIPQLLGMTPKGGNYSGGVIFKMNLGGTGFDTLYSFNSPSGDAPSGDLFKANDNLLYGTTFYGGANLYGAIFSFDPSNNSYKDVHNFDTTTGIQSEGSLIQASNGTLYGMTGAGGAHNFGVLYSYTIAGTTYNDIHDFDSTNGSYPYGDLLLSNNGKLYGMTQFGGAHNFGIIFSFDTLTKKLTDLHNFDSVSGRWPYGSLVQAGNRLFGLTANGGINDEGVLFSYDILTASFTKLYDFNSDSGELPSGNLLLNTNGIFYGTASGGGANSDGVIFSFDTLSNKYSDLFDFDGTNGQSPNASLILASDNKLYGMASFGGADSSNGTIFSFDPSDSDCIDIHDFNNLEGKNPSGNLIEINATGIKQLAAINNQLLIYPNPASNQLTIISNQSSISEIKVINIMGQIVYMLTLPNGQYSKQINVNYLPPGLYFVSVTSNNQTITNKISIIKNSYYRM